MVAGTEHCRSITQNVCLSACLLFSHSLLPCTLFTLLYLDAQTPLRMKLRKTDMKTDWTLACRQISLLYVTADMVRMC